MHRRLAPVLLSALVALALAPAAAAQSWSADVLDPSTVDADATGAVVPAADLAAAPGKPQNLSLYPLAGTPAPPAGGMAQRYVFVANGQTPADFPPSVAGRIALVKVTNGLTTTFAQVVSSAAASGAEAVLMISSTTNGTAVTGTIPGATIAPVDGEILVDLIDETTDATDPPPGTISAYPLRINPGVSPNALPVSVPDTPTGGAYRGTRVARGTTPDFEGNPNVLAPYDGPPLQAAVFPVGRGASEPTLGVLASGTGFFAAADFDSAAAGVLPRTLVMRSTDGGRSWSSVSPPLPDPLKSSPPINGDPMLYVDARTGRVFSLDTYDADCMWLIFSDDEGETWSQNPVACDTGSVTDHQTIFAGPPPAGEEALGTLYPDVVYACWNTVASVNCLRSLDGGATFTKAGSPYLGYEPDNDGPGFNEGVPGLCGGLTAHVRTDGAGRVFLPAARCALPRVAISGDAGLTWTVSEVSHAIPVAGGEHEDPLAVDDADNLYVVWWDANDRLPYLSVSRDHGATWSAPLMIAPPGVQEVNFPTVAAGEEGRVVVHFPGTVVADRGDSGRPWNLYEVVTTDALDPDPLFVFTTANDPAHPVHRGDCGPGRCGGMFDFLDVVVPPPGVPAASRGFWASGVDTCDADCEEFGSAAADNAGVVVRQLGGPDLRAQALVVEDTDPALEYAGGWHRVKDAGASAGTYHRRVGGKNGVGSEPSVRLVFTGDALTYHYATSSAGGSADVFLDGAPAGTVSFAGATSEPAFGASTTFDHLGEGSHELRIVYRSGIASLDKLVIQPASRSASSDASAVTLRSVTDATDALLGGLSGATATTAILADPATRELSVEVAGSDHPLDVQVLDPEGALVARGGALLDGATISGTDLVPLVGGLYTVRVSDPAGGASAVRISVARTVEVTP